MSKQQLNIIFGYMEFVTIVNDMDCVMSKQVDFPYAVYNNINNSFNGGLLSSLVYEKIRAQVK
jgi:hypothetical protein